MLRDWVLRSDKGKSQMPEASAENSIDNADCEAEGNPNRISSSLLANRTRRVNCWFEPTYSPELAERFVSGDLRKVQKNTALTAFDGAGKETYFLEKRDLTFENCDFYGKFDRRPASISFKGCTFLGCDFGLSIWNSAKFSGCTFERCSFGMTTFESCQFRGCTFIETGLSSNETIISETYISDPAGFIGSTYNCLDKVMLLRHKANEDYQIFKWQDTKATIARMIYVSHKTVGGDEDFHAASRTFLLEGSKFRIREAQRNISTREVLNWYNIMGRLWRLFQQRSTLLSRHVDLLLVRLFGFLSGWGGSSSISLFFIFIQFLIFSMLYLSSGDEIGAAFARSFHISSLAGYTAAVSENDSMIITMIRLIQLIASVILYSVFFASLISHTSKSR